jgi:proline iminopeptidase
VHVRVGGIRLFFDVEGAKLVPDGPAMRERPTLLLLHGGPGADHSQYKPWLSELADVAQVVYLDHRANGRSEAGDPASWTLAQWGDDVRAFCEALGIERPVVMGTSFGGYVALAYATRHPDHPGALVLCSTSARRHSARSLAVYERLGGAKAREVARRIEEAPDAAAAQEFFEVCVPLYSRAPRDDEAIARVRWNHELMLRFMATERRRFDFRPALSTIRCPTLVLGGEDDPVTPIEDQQEIAAGIGPNARLVHFPRCGHGVVHDDPQGFVSQLRAFLASI